MLNLLAAIAITGATATSPMPATTAHPKPHLSLAAHEGAKLTEQQKRWFGNAVEHILQGQP